MTHVLCAHQKLSRSSISILSISFVAAGLIAALPEAHAGDFDRPSVGQSANSGKSGFRGSAPASKASTTSSASKSFSAAKSAPSTRSAANKGSFKAPAPAAAPTGFSIDGFPAEPESLDVGGTFAPLQGNSQFKRSTAVIEDIAPSFASPAVVEQQTARLAKPEFKTATKSRTNLGITFRQKLSNLNLPKPRNLPKISSKRDEVRELVRQVGARFAESPAVKKARMTEEAFIEMFSAMIHRESNYNPVAKSPVGAQGLGQLMPGTAKELGVRDPFSPEENLEGAATYLTQMLGKFGEPELALAAYNAGPGAVKRYNGIPPFKETRQYVADIFNAVGNITHVAEVAPQDYAMAASLYDEELPLPTQAEPEPEVKKEKQPLHSIVFSGVKSSVLGLFGRKKESPALSQQEMALLEEFREFQELKAKPVEDMPATVTASVKKKEAVKFSAKPKAKKKATSAAAKTVKKKDKKKAKAAVAAPAKLKAKSAAKSKFSFFGKTEKKAAKAKPDVAKKVSKIRPATKISHFTR